MSKIKNMIAKESSTWVTFPEIEGFEVNLRFLTREDLLKIRTASLAFKELANVKKKLIALSSLKHTLRKLLQAGEA